MVRRNRAFGTRTLAAKPSLVVVREDPVVPVPGAVGVYAQITAWDVAGVVPGSNSLQRISARIDIHQGPSAAGLGQGTLVKWYLLKLPAGALIPNVATALAWQTTLRGIKVLDFKAYIVGATTIPKTVKMGSRVQQMLATDRLVLVAASVGVTAAAVPAPAYVVSRFMSHT